MVRTRPKKNPGRFRTALIGYGLLVLLSNAFRAFYPSQHLPESGQKQVAIAGGMEIAYSESGSLGPDIPTIVLLHGSPMGAEMFSELLPILQQSCRVIVPDLVGYGASTPKAADYSIHAQAGYMLALMDALGLERAQVAGYSFGGGVAIAMADIAPGRIISLALLSSLGVQELELLGDSQLNRGIHGIQLALIWLLHEGTPHFGWLDTGLLSKAYARSFFDTDQVPLRGALTRYQKPMLIIHGRADFQVPPATAEEHHRIVPQSESVWLSGEHDLAGTHPGHLAEILSDFAHRVARGEAATRSDATPERIRLSEERFEGRALPRAQGAYFWVLMFLIILASLVSEDLACIGAGLMASRGILDFGSATLASLAGIVLGDMALYLAGRWLGRPILRYAPVRWFVTEARLDRSARWFRAKGPIIILMSRFLPGSRLPTYFGVGVLGAGFWVFSLYFLAAAILWTPILVGLSYLIGHQLLAYFSVYEKYVIPVLLFAIFGLRGMVKFVLALINHRGRRLLLSAWRRKTRWEFWPIGFFYIPIVA